MKQKLILLLLITIFLGGTGCGGGGNSDSSTPAVSTITRATENTFSESARILAARDAETSGATWLDADRAKRYDADMTLIRANYPVIKDIQARGTHDLHTIVVAVPAKASWTTNWKAGKANTGEAALDALLEEFVPEEITTIGDPTEAKIVYFTLRFGQSLNMVKLAERMTVASKTILRADTNFAAGDGNNIIQTTDTSADGTRQYEFSLGWGDCQAGCIFQHSWHFAVSRDGKTATLTDETGAPLGSVGSPRY